MKTIRYTEEQTLEAVGPLTRSRLHRLVETECVMPQEDDGAPVFTEAELARIELCCELSDDLDLDEEALPVVMNLLDQVHSLRRQMRLMMRAIEGEPEEVRARLRAAFAEIGVKFLRGASAVRKRESR